jgi:hypothetical protein
MKQSLLIFLLQISFRRNIFKIKKLQLKKSKTFKVYLVVSAIIKNICFYSQPSNSLKFIGVLLQEFFTFLFF